MRPLGGASCRPCGRWTMWPSTPRARPARTCSALASAQAQRWQPGRCGQRRCSPLSVHWQRGQGQPRHGQLRPLPGFRMDCERAGRPGRARSKKRTPRAADSLLSRVAFGPLATQAAAGGPLGAAGLRSIRARAPSCCRRPAACGALPPPAAHRPLHANRLHAAPAARRGEQQRIGAVGLVPFGRPQRAAHCPQQRLPAACLSAAGRPFTFPSHLLTCSPRPAATAMRSRQGMNRSFY